VYRGPIKLVIKVHRD